MGTQHGTQTADATSSALGGQVEEREAEWEAWRAWWAQRAGEGKAEEAWVDEGGTEDAWEEAEEEEEEEEEEEVRQPPAKARRRV